MFNWDFKKCKEDYFHAEIKKRATHMSSVSRAYEKSENAMFANPYHNTT